MELKELPIRIPAQNSFSLINGIKSIYRQNPSNVTDQTYFPCILNTAAYWQ